jgi:hypothetical protein
MMSVSPPGRCFVLARRASEGASTQSARRELNPPIRFGRPMPRPLGHAHVRKRKERELNPQGLNEASPGFEPGAIANWLALPFE